MQQTATEFRPVIEDLITRLTDALELNSAALLNLTERIDEMTEQAAAQADLHATSTKPAWLEIPLISERIQ
jgi:hypothetical protein